MNRTILADFGVLLKDVKAKRALVNIAALDSFVEVHRIAIVRIDGNATPQTDLIFAQFQREGFVSAQHETSLVVNECADIVPKCFRKSTRRNALRSTRPEFIDGIKHGKITLDVKVIVRFPRFKFRCNRSHLSQLSVHVRPPASI